MNIIEETMSKTKRRTRRYQATGVTTSFCFLGLRNGLVMVDIKPKLLRILILDPWRRCTQRFQWLNLWGAVVPDESKYHLSEDAKRVVVRLRKVHDSLTAGSGA